jgi:hypothetical protein
VRTLEAIARRLGFDLVSHRLELFGRRRAEESAPAPKTKPAKPKPAMRGARS